MYNIKRIKPDAWLPADNIILESNAASVARCKENTLVVAGPGAGKTELLAQRACYLLQTNTCRFPYKILAISFKRDAAYNLKERVKLRCGEELSRRFDSMTFDSFAKQILDRFKHALPAAYNLNGEYEVILSDQTVLDMYELEDTVYFNTTDRRAILEMHSNQLPHFDGTQGQQVRSAVWRRMLQSIPSKLSFKMIMRMAEFVINSNPKIKRYLQQTYQYVFLDEFQDTTGIQYDLFKSCFLGGTSIVTAVGDDKQRIMLWAGAENAIFQQFTIDTHATRVPLTMNFRCAPRLVSLLNHLAEHLLGKTDFATPSPKWRLDQGECVIKVFDDPIAERELLFRAVNKWIIKDGLKPRDICILVKQQLGVYAGELIRYFNENGIKARDENRFQDLLTQDIASYILSMLYVLFSKNAATERQIMFRFLCNLHTEMEDDQLLRLEVTIAKFVKEMKQEYGNITLTEEHIKSIIAKIVSFAGSERIRASIPQYRNKVVLASIIENIESELIECYNVTRQLPLALDALVGKDTIPVMTIHKSKGLEYHTVIFIGLEDGAFWSFQRQPDEDKCAFFVALSRARERVVFTFSKRREGRFGMQTQSTQNIRVIFDELAKSNIVSVVEEKL